MWLQSQWSQCLLFPVWLEPGLCWENWLSWVIWLHLESIFALSITPQEINIFNPSTALQTLKDYWEIEYIFNIRRYLNIWLSNTDCRLCWKLNFLPFEICCSNPWCVVWTICWISCMFWGFLGWRLHRSHQWWAPCCQCGCWRRLHCAHIPPCCLPSYSQFSCGKDV